MQDDPETPEDVFLSGLSKDLAAAVVACLCHFAFFGKLWFASNRLQRHAF